MPTIKQRYKPKIPFIPYLHMPLAHYLSITEGFIYSQAERQAHHVFFHKAIDYASDYGTPVYAAAEGYAVAGYHRFTLRDKDGFPYSLTTSQWQTDLDTLYRYFILKRYVE